MKNAPRIGSIFSYGISGSMDRGKKFENYYMKDFLYTVLIIGVLFIAVYMQDIELDLMAFLGKGVLIGLAVGAIWGILSLMAKYQKK